jgi:pSer/pThr/pTyr-binding forkhead associated (FHA) protein
MGSLVGVSENAKGRTCEVAAQMQTVIGRTKDCGICLDDGRISRRHCAITADETGFTVKDLGSVNGTFLNGQRLTPYLPHPLHDKDELQIGRIRLQVGIH